MGYRTTLLCLALAATCVSCQRSGSAEQSAGKVALGGKVPDFAVATLQGTSLKLSDLRKKSSSGVVVLTFWCSFCGSCRHMEQQLDQLARDYRDKVTVVGLDASAGETADKVAAFIKGKGLKVPILLDAGGKSADILGTRLTTTTVVIDKDGVLRYRGQFGHGKHTPAEDALKAVLAGKEVAVPETPHRG